MAQDSHSLLQQMIQEYGDRIFRLALRYTGDYFQAEDIAQETFLRAFTHLESYRRDKPAGPWLFTITVNLCRSQFRSRRETPVAEIRESSKEPGPELQYLEKEGEQELLQALRLLPEMYRLPLLLKHVSELSYGEICEVLGWELSLVKNRLYRGRIMLKKSYESRKETG
ncbi:RNA polymerase sigma factor [Candidatus Contubernalis alkaliaceticus]|uniref:RNA polymerase sigma factor n=1 Tax=Candidatus Contubernalis alkaliaceticus TaxID=338645 RepID=UPI001F4C2FF2|nr:sigma-70 family RNA polymerase sigma factor [Candidatus Contubernalis alkalaceticus]